MVGVAASGSLGCLRERGRYFSFEKLVVDYLDLSQNTLANCSVYLLS